ncbi:MAG: hypothetical protein ACPGR7_04195 [Flavobacteriaceae bacterium]
MRKVLELMLLMIFVLGSCNPKPKAKLVSVKISEVQIDSFHKLIDPYEQTPYGDLELPKIIKLRRTFNSEKHFSTMIQDIDGSEWLYK